MTPIADRHYGTRPRNDGADHVPGLVSSSWRRTTHLGSALALTALIARRASLAAPRRLLIARFCALRTGMRNIRCRKTCIARLLSHLLSRPYTLPTPTAERRWCKAPGRAARVLQRERRLPCVGVYALASPAPIMGNGFCALLGKAVRIRSPMPNWGQAKGRMNVPPAKSQPSRSIET